MRYLLFTVFLFIVPNFASKAQSIISGSVADEANAEPLIGATVVIKESNEASVIDINGNFKIETKQNFPLTIIITFLGYNTKEIIVNEPSEKLKIKLSSNEVALKAIEVSDIRISEKQKQSALTVEAMDLIAIKEVAGGNFYDGLANLKGVDITAASLGFKVINTRGFNSTSPVRSLQLIDGVDNQSPGLNFSLGNFLGSSDLDVMKVDIVAGASSAFYGPNAFNGVINMTTKNPWQFQGLSVSAKVGERNLNEYAVRWADVIKNKAGKEKFAYKFNFFTMKANDWEAQNYDPTIDSKRGKNNQGGFDAVNIYGDEALGGGNNYTSYGNQINFPGMGVIYRNGYKEEDMVDYNTENIKTQASLHYKITDKIEVIAAGNYSKGSTIYQGDNRYALRNIQFYQARFEIKQENNCDSINIDKVKPFERSYSQTLTDITSNDGNFSVSVRSIEKTESSILLTALNSLQQIWFNSTKQSKTIKSETSINKNKVYPIDKISSQSSFATLFLINKVSNSIIPFSENNKLLKDNNNEIVNHITSKSKNDHNNVMKIDSLDDVTLINENCNNFDINDNINTSINDTNMNNNYSKASPRLEAYYEEINIYERVKSSKR
jgi:outer membrane receptor protein involved in Fe transport